MSYAAEIRAGFREVGVALRRPEEFTTRWRDRQQGNAPRPVVFAVLLLSAFSGLAAYGLTMGLGSGLGAMVQGALKAPLAAGAAWAVALPALYIINSALGSRLDWSTTLLASLTTLSFGALAMLASVPITWFFTVAVPWKWVHIAVHLVTFAGVSVCMIDVFMRSMKALEPHRTHVYEVVWLSLVGVIGGELMLLFNLFQLNG